jgi:hypothetical protein
VTEAGPRWLLLIHQIPPKPAYLRVKVGRRLQGLGAVPVKNSVYVLPRSEQALEDFHWVRAEIVAGGGDASVCEAGFLEGLSDQALEALFNSARDADYAEVGRRFTPPPAAPPLTGNRPRPLARLRGVSRTWRRWILPRARAQRSGRAAGRGVFRNPPTPARRTPTALARPGRTGSRGASSSTASPARGSSAASSTRGAVQVRAQPRLQAARGGSVRHFEAEFTHEGDLCTFEVLVRRFRRDDPALRHLAEIVHDIDLKDSKFSRPEAPGLEHLLSGIAMRHPDDVARIDDGSAVFEGLYEYFRRKK